MLTKYRGSNHKHTKSILKTICETSLSTSESAIFWVSVLISVCTEPTKYWSNTGQILVKYWSNTGQIRSRSRRPSGVTGLRPVFAAGGCSRGQRSEFAAGVCRRTRSCLQGGSFRTRSCLHKLFTAGPGAAHSRTWSCLQQDQELVAAGSLLWEQMQLDCQDEMRRSNTGQIRSLQPDPRV
jgi:hypothetical protein